MVVVVVVQPGLAAGDVALAAECVVLAAARPALAEAQAMVTVHLRA